MVEGKTPTVVSPESNIKVSYDYEPAPTQIIVQQFLDEQTIDVSLQDGYFQSPQEKGAYNRYGIQPP